jgi:hypothetical protein
MPRLRRSRNVKKRGVPRMRSKLRRRKKREKGKRKGKGRKSEPDRREQYYDHHSPVSIRVSRIQIKLQIAENIAKKLEENSKVKFKEPSAGN